MSHTRRSLADADDTVIEGSDGSLGTIDHPHREIHEGNHYTVSKIFIEVADDGTALIRITTGANKKIHTVYRVVAEGKAYVRFYEDTTYTEDGSAMVEFNNERSQADSTETIARFTPTIDSLGTLLLEDILEGGTGPLSVGATNGTRTEWVGNVSSDYLIHVTNVSGQAKDISILVQWYEE